MACGFSHEKRLNAQGFNVIIGVDEAGRGPLAGPVVAGAVALSTAHFENRIDDSKKLTPYQRECAYLEIIEKSVYGIGIVNEKIIDRLNIRVATRLAMENAVRALIAKLKAPESDRIHVLIDGNMGIDVAFPFTTIIKGDAQSMSIASGSILAKVTRDRIMSLYDKVFPEYGFIQHKGYPTKSHRQALKEFGPSIIHRVTFCGVRS
jgi:ribonuclease HII